MKQLQHWIVWMMCCSPAVAQVKPAIDSKAYESWEFLHNLDESGGRISPDGKLVLHLHDVGKGQANLVITSTDGKMKQVIEYARTPFFTTDSRQVYFIWANDSLSVWDWREQRIHLVDRTDNYELIQPYDRELLVYKKDNEVIVQDLRTKKKHTYAGVQEWLLSPGKHSMVLKTADGLRWVDMKRQTVTDIFNDGNVSGLVFDTDGTKLAFIHGNALMRYKRGMQAAEVYVNSATPGIPEGFTIASEKPIFNKTGNRLFFRLQRKVVAAARDERMATVNVWNYKDTMLQSEQRGRLEDNFDKYVPPDRKALFLAVRNDGAEDVLLLEQEADNLQSYTITFDKADYLLSRFGMGCTLADGYWNEDALPTYQLISTATGERVLLPVEKQPWLHVRLSPCERYVIWFDYRRKGYLCYDIASRALRNITAQIPYPVYYDVAEEPSQQQSYWPVTWSDKGAFVYLCDQYDIWKVDMRGVEKPVCITGGYGRVHKLIFSFIPVSFHELGIDGKKEYLLAVYSQEKKLNGFARIVPDKPGPPQMGGMEPYTFCIPRITPSGFVAFADFIGHPAKARDANVYIIRRQSAEESPNLFVTKDFKTFQRVSDIYPEKAYNWLTTELVTWQTPDGKTTQGILYKPENLDTTRKYPLIFHYYMKRSDELHKFLRPENSAGVMDIPTYVSNGYLVFVPDIYYTIGHPAISATNTMESAATCLSKRPYVDTGKMGLHGFSYGGYQTNAIIANSKRFAAACSAAGVSNLSSGFAGLRSNGETSQWIYETSQGNMGVAPWERPDLYMENSPVFQIGRIATPLLLMANRNDGNVPFTQSVELFTGMRRAGKKVWMLEYDGEGHGIIEPKNSRDFTIRMQQFFDHYLKGTPPPVWMTKGVPAKDKGIAFGLELDLSGAQP